MVLAVQNILKPHKVLNNTQHASSGIGRGKKNPTVQQYISKQPILLNIDTYTRFICCGAVGHNQCQQEHSLQSTEVGTVFRDPTCPYCGKQNDSKTSSEKGFAQLNEWVQKGKSWAQTMLGACYMEGNTPSGLCYIKAKHFLELAAEQDDAVGISNLATMYQEGKAYDPIITSR